MRKYIKFIILILVAAFIFWYFGRNLDWQGVSESIRRANAYYLVAATLIICLGYFLRAVRWQVLLAPITESSLKELFATTTVGFAAIFLVGRAAEIVRPMWLPMRDPRVRPSAALVTLGLERIFDLAALVCFFSANLLFFSPPPGREDDFEHIAWIGYFLLFSVFAGFCSLIVYQRNSLKFIEWMKGFIAQKFIPIRLQRMVISILEQLSAALAILTSWRETFWVFVWTLALWFAISIPTWFVLKAFDLPITFADALFIMGFATVSSLVPTPGGAAGAFHAATAASLIFLKPDTKHEDAAAMSIVMNLVYSAPALGFGLYYLIRGDISIERFRGLLSGGNAIEEIESESPSRD